MNFLSCGKIIKIAFLFFKFNNTYFLIHFLFQNITIRTPSSILPLIMDFRRWSVWLWAVSVMKPFRPQIPKEKLQENLLLIRDTRKYQTCYLSKCFLILIHGSKKITEKNIYPKGLILTCLYGLHKVHKIKDNDKTHLNFLFIFSIFIFTYLGF